MIGRKLSNFHINERIGEGGMGTVYLATDLHLNRTVAIKMLHPFLVSNPESFKRFRNEAHLSARISHPNVATLFNFQASGDTHFIVMEFVNGRALDDVLKLQGRLPEQEAAKIILQVLEGLGAAHDLGIMHRDLKPGNIMITNRGFVKLMDFGIARLENTERMTRQNSVIGTLEYLSPELVKGGAPSKASDLYAVGVMFYEMLTGKSLFAGDSEAAVMYQIAHERINVQIPGANRKLVKIIKKLTHKDVAKRYQSTQEVIHDLEQLFQGGKVNTLLMSEKLEQASSESGVKAALPVSFTLPTRDQLPTIKLPFDLDLRILAGAAAVCLLILFIGRGSAVDPTKEPDVTEPTSELTDGMEEARTNEEYLADLSPQSPTTLGQTQAGTIEFIERFDQEPTTPKQEEKRGQEKAKEQPKKSTPQKSTPSPTKKEPQASTKTKKVAQTIVPQEQKIPESKETMAQTKTRTSPSEKAVPATPQSPEVKSFTPSQRKGGGETVKIRIPDLFLSASFTETVSSEKNHEGESIYLSTSSDVYQGDHLIIPRGAKVKAVVKKVRKAEGRKRAFLAINLQSVQAINGEWLTISYPEYSNLSKTLVEFKRGSQLNRIKLKSTNLTLNKSF